MAEVLRKFITFIGMTPQNIIFLLYRMRGAISNFSYHHRKTEKLKDC
jgi:hypothetical protein